MRQKKFQKREKYLDATDFQISSINLQPPAAISSPDSSNDGDLLNAKDVVTSQALYPDLSTAPDCGNPWVNQQYPVYQGGLAPPSQYQQAQQLPQPTVQ